jgi:hypothetical protein
LTGKPERNWRCLRTGCRGEYVDLVVGGWRRLHNEELHNLYASPNAIRVIKSRRMRWAGHVARMGKLEMRTVFWLEDLKRRDHLKNVGIYGKIILEWILGKGADGAQWFSAGLLAR